MYVECFNYAHLEVCMPPPPHPLVHPLFSQLPTFENEYASQNHDGFSVADEPNSFEIKNHLVWTSSLENWLVLDLLCRVKSLESTREMMLKKRHERECGAVANSLNQVLMNILYYLRKHTR